MFKSTQSNKTCVLTNQSQLVIAKIQHRVKKKNSYRKIFVLCFIDHLLVSNLTQHNAQKAIFFA